MEYRHDLKLLFTCEHGGNTVPPDYASLFESARAALDSHLGYDAGALDLARMLALHFGAPLYASTVTRLLVDLNRSPGHRAVLSRWSRRLHGRDRVALLARYHTPHRSNVQDAVADAIARGRTVLHVAVHTFTREYHGVVRNADLGLLYDPRRERETALCRLWRHVLRTLHGGGVRLNYPYHGATDGLTTALRQHFPEDRYLGIELEVNQRLLADPPAWRAVTDALTSSLDSAIRLGAQALSVGAS